MTIQSYFRMGKPTFDKIFTLIDNERRFRAACEQIFQLNQKIESLRYRFNATPSALKNFRYNLCMRLSVYEEVRNMYYEYAHTKAETIASLKEEMYYSSDDSDD